MCFRLCFSLFLFLAKQASAQSSLISVLPGYRDIAAYSSRFADAFSARLNPALLARQEMLSAGMFTEQKYLLPELVSVHSAVIVPVSSGAFSAAAEYAGSRFHH